MANNNQTDIQLRITAAIDGLVEIAKLINEVDKLGGQTTESSAEVDKLVSELDTLRQQDQLISQFQQLKKSTADLSNTMDDARSRATALGKGVADSKVAIASTNAEYKASKTNTQQLADEWQQAKAKVALLSKAIKDSAAPTREQRDELKLARAEAQKFGEQYRASSKETSALENSLNQSKSALTQQTKEFNSARKEVNQLDAQYQKQSGTLNTLRTELQQTGVNTKQLISEQRNLKSATAQAEKEVGDLATKLREQAELQKYVVQNTDLSGKELLQYSAAASQAKTETAGLNNNVTASGTGFVSFAKNIMATAAAFFTLDRAKDSLVSIVETGSQMDVLSKTAERAGLSFEQLNTFAGNTPLQLQEVIDAAIAAKNMGIDPMSGALQAATDAAYANGKGAEYVNRIILALGQAYSKEKLQQEEVLQLVEAGIPAWQLLADATGKSVPELQKLSTAGALGRKEIDLLIAAMGDKYAGAAQSVMDSTSGLASNLADEFTRAKNEVAQSGLMDYVNSQLREAIAYLKQIREDGTLTEWGRNVSATLKAISDGTVSAVQTIRDYNGEITAAIKIWAGFKIVSWTNDILKFASGWKEVATSVSAAAKAAPLVSLLSNPITALSVALAGASKLALDLAKNYFDLTTGQEIKNRIAEQERALNQQLISQGNELMAQNAQNKDLQYLTADAIKYMSDIDRQRYQQALEGNQNYIAGQLQVNAALERAGLLTEEQKSKTQAAASAMRQAFADFADGEQQHLAQASKSIDDYVADIEHAKSVAEGLANSSLTDVFKTAGLDFEQISGGIGTTVQAYISGLTQMEQATNVSGVAINTYLAKAFDGAKNQTELDALIAKVDVLHSQGKLVGEAYISSLGAAADAAKSMAGVSTEAGQTYIDILRKQKAAADEAYKATGLEQYKLKAGELNLQLEKLTNTQQKNATASNDLEQAFSELGMKSAAALEEAAAKAEAAYSRMSTAGTTSLNQQKEAFLVWAKAELEAANASGRLPSSLLQSQAASMGLTNELAALTAQVQTVGAESLVTAGALIQMGAAAGASSQNVGYASNNWSKLKDNVDKTNSSVTTYTKMTPLFKAETYDAAVATDYMSMSMADLTAEIDKNSTAFKNMQRNSVALMGPSGFESWVSAIDGQSAAVYRMRAQLGRAALDVRNLQTALSENPSETLINRAEHAVSKYKELGDQNLSGLKSAIDAAKSKMDALNSSVQNTLNSLRDEMDEMNNNTAAIENRRYQTQVAELEQSLAEARAWNDTQAIASARESLRLAQQIHNQKMETINAEKEASKTSSVSSSNNTTSTSSTGSSTATSSKTITIKLGGKTATVNADAANEAALDQILSQLESASSLTTS